MTDGALRLRGPGGPLPARVHWPGQRPAPLLLLFGGAADAAAAAGFVVVAVRAAEEDEVRTVLEWCAAHAAELDARLPVHLSVAEAAHPPVAAVLAEVERAGWPPVRLISAPGVENRHPGSTYW